jgi:hypothetical protein
VEELNITTPLLLPLVVNTPFTEEEKVGMDPVLWLQVTTLFFFSNVRLS